MDAIENGEAIDLKLLKVSFKKKEIDYWKKESEKKPKLRIFNKIKVGNSTENYVSLNLDRSQRSFIAQI